MTHQSFEQSSVQLMNKLTGPKPLFVVYVQMDNKCRAALKELADAKEITESQLMVQALRLYQKVDREGLQLELNDNSNH